MVPPKLHWVASMKRFLSAALFLLSVFATVTGAGAKIIVVTTPADNGAGSLRAAVAGAVKGDTITFDAGLSGQTITLTSGEISVTKAITINGLGAANLAISGNHISRIFNFNVNAVSTITDLTLTDGESANDGGAIVSSANLTLSRVVLTGNRASISGGAVTSRFGAAFTISDCTFSNNTSGLLSGALYTDGKNNSIVGSTFTANMVLNAGFGGAIFNDGSLSITRSAISNNANVGKGGVAGGIYSDGVVTLIDTTISGNSADTGGVGGGFYNAGTVTLRNSTVSANRVGDATSFFAAQGGGIYNEEGATVTVLNSTIANNSVGAGGQGGGIYSDGNLTVNNSTIAGNATGAGGSGGGIFSSMAVTMANTIAAQNNAPSAPDFSGLVSSQGFNLIGDTTGSTGEIAADIINVDPKLGPLQDNGPFTQTMALLLHSPAIEHGNPAFDPNLFSPPLTTDQRGNPRITGVIDIGAFEADLPHEPVIEELSLPQTMECSSGEGTQASVRASVSDNKAHALSVQWFVNDELKQTDQIDGTTPMTKGSSIYTGNFPCGTTSIMVSVADGQSEPVIQSTTVTMVDTTPPTISNLSADRIVLWPPNHKMVSVKVNATVTDSCDAAPKCKILSVTSNEPGAGQFELAGDMTINLRAERTGNGSGRIYTITVQATDAMGNSVTRDVNVSVPKSP